MVGKKDAHEHVFSMVQSVETDPRVASLGMDKIMDRSQTSFQALKVINESSDGWGPDEWQNKKNAALQAIEEFEEAFKRMLTYAKSVEKVKLEHGGKEKCDKRNARNAKMKIVEKMQVLGVPQPAAQHFASQLQPRTSYQEAWSVADYDDIEYSDGCDMRRPHTITEEGKTKIHEAVAKMHTVLNGVDSKKFGKAVEAIQRNNLQLPEGSDENTHAVLAIDDAADLDLKEFGALFKVHEDKLVTPIYNVQKLWAFNGATEFNPVACTSGVLMVLSGTFMVTIVPLKYMLDGDAGLATLDKYFESLDEEAMKAFSTFAVPAGSSLFCPFGSFALVVACAGTGVGGSGSSKGKVVREEDTKAYASYTVIPTLDVELVSKELAPVQVEVSTYLTRGMTQQKRVYKKFGDKVQAYLNAWPKVAEPEVEGE